jgi:hypothetical protein
MINFAEFMDNMNNEEVELPESTRHEVGGGGGSVQQSSLVNSRNIVEVHTMKSGGDQRTETVRIDKKVQPFIPVVTEERVEKKQPAYNFAAFMDQLEVEQEEARAEQKPKEKKKDKT